MPIFNPRPPWEHAKTSCGQEIPVQGLGRGNRAWYAVGQASAIFENSLKETVHRVMRVVNAEYVDIFVRVYMIGKNELASRPTIMICCVDKSVGTLAKRALNESDLLRRFPQFIFGWSKHPLELSRPSRALAGESSAWSSGNPDANYLKGQDEEVFSSSSSPVMGRRLYRCRADGRLLPWNTGGVLLQVSDRFYQLTAEHIWAEQLQQNDGIDQNSEDDNAYSIDGLDDEDTSQNQASQYDHDVLSQGSLTPAPSLISPSSFSLDQPTDNHWDEGSSDEDLDDEKMALPPSPSHISGFETAANSIDPSWCLPQPTPHHKAIAKVGVMSVEASTGNNPGLDYAIVEIAPPAVFDLVNAFVLTNAEEQRRVVVRAISQQENAERNVFLVTENGRVKKGVIIPGTTLFKRQDLKSFEELVILQMNGLVTEGDCGAAVVDQLSGAFCGHLIRGCLGTGTAYIVPASNIFRDLSSRGFPPILASTSGERLTLGKDDVEKASRDSLVTRQDVKRGKSVQKSPLQMSSGEDYGMSSVVSGFSYEYRARLQWPKYFRSRTCVSLNWENHPRALSYNFMPDDEINDGFFATNVSGNQQFHRAQILRNFCRGATMASLERTEQQRHSVWLHQTDYQGSMRPFRGILSAIQLYEELRKPRYLCQYDYDLASDTLDADKRFIYVDGLDAHIALALTTSCAESEFWALREMLYYHITYQPQFAVSFLTCGVTRFVLSFNIPFVTIRRHAYRIEDDRRDEDGKSIRQSTDLSSIFPQKSSSFMDCHTHMLYQSHASCSIVGLDETRWTAYCFVDSFFGCREDSCSAERSGHDVEDGLLTDPLVFGKEDAMKSSQKSPREYFLAVLEGHASEVAEEWAHTVWRLTKLIQSNLSTDTVTMTQDNQEAIPNPVESIDRYIRLNNLIYQLLTTIRGTLEAWKEFEAAQLPVLSDTEDLNTTNVSSFGRMFEIRRSFQEITECHRTLRNLKELVNSACTSAQDRLTASEKHSALKFTKPVNNEHLNVNGITRSLKILTLISFAFIPLSLATTMMSMNESAIPFRPSPETFLASLSIITFGLTVYILLATKSWGHGMLQIRQMWLTPRAHSANDHLPPPATMDRQSARDEFETVRRRGVDRRENACWV